MWSDRRRPVTFVEIDVLRDGDQLQTLERFPPGNDFANVSREDRRPKGYAWPILLPKRLLVIGMALKEGVGELDLQSVLAMANDRATHDLQD